MLEEERNLIMKKLLLVGLSAIALAACGSTSEQESAPSEASASTDEVSSETSEQDNSTSELGKRSNPVPFGETGTVETTAFDDESNTVEGTLDITLSNLVRGEEAYNQLVEWNEFNAEAPEGQEWVIFDADVVYNSDNADVPYLISGFVAVDSTGAEVQQNEYAFTPNEIVATEIYAGGETTGSYAIVAPTGEDILLKYTDGMTDAFFSAE